MFWQRSPQFLLFFPLWSSVSLSFRSDLHCLAVLFLIGVDHIHRVLDFDGAFLNARI